MGAHSLKSLAQAADSGGLPRTTRAAAWPWRVRLVFTKVGLSVGRGVAADQVEVALRVGLVAVQRRAGSGRG